MNRKIQNKFQDLLYTSKETDLTIVIREFPTPNLRWLKKKNGERILQQAYTIEYLNRIETKWVDIEEVEDEKKNNKAK